jgi:hypothetical protein
MKTRDREPNRIAKLVSTAKRLRATRAACRKFLALWALQQGGKNCAPSARGRQEKQLADPMNHDWSLLYLGSILDD